MDLRQLTMNDDAPSITPASEVASEPMGPSPEKESPLVEYSSSPPPLIRDDSGLLEESEARLHNQLELSAYEYAALEERYRTLSGQHRELQKLASSYHNIIRGSFSCDDEDVSLDQLRVEAGREGFRARALEADALRPIVRRAGSLEALTSQVQSMGCLIEQAGSIHELEELVEDARMLRSRVDAVGGLYGLDHLVSEVNHLRAEQQAFTLMRHSIDGPDGLKAKALKYDMLQQAFADIQRGSTVGHQVGLSAAPEGVMQANSAVAPSQTPAAMNPDRARLLLSAPPARDPDRRLYEPPPPPSKPTTKTGSNQEPLGTPRKGRQSGSQELLKTNSLKRMQQDESPYNVLKRPRVDLGCASAMGKATFPPATTRPRAANITIKTEEPESHPVAVQDLGKPSDAAANRSVFVRIDREPSADSIYPAAQIIVKEEAHKDECHPLSPDMLLARSLNAHDSNAVMVGNHPIALWIGSGDASSEITTNLIRITDIPLSLARFLAYNVNRHIMEVDYQNWLSMPPNNDICVLRYLLDRHRPTGQPQERRSCRLCTSSWVRHHRPCALLQEIDEVRMVVFVPLKEALRRGIDWTQKSYWVMDAK